MKIDIKKGYAVQRKADYPSVEEQLDMIYHDGLDAWMERIKQTKDRFPKGE
ncbi:hypothetical protein [Sphingomonas sp. IC081]|uniref:hypothetical protein n=1 Tax=Sphingomonas sp. IC081 TaxID=304378 RepID=UPI00163C2717|nr:hypothetical protein [Sphingomonas sp. IC081]